MSGGVTNRGGSLPGGSLPGVTARVPVVLAGSFMSQINETGPKLT